MSFGGIFVLYRRVLKGRLGHTSGSPFHAQRYLFNQIHSFSLLHCVTQSLLWIDWLISGLIFSRAWLLCSYQMIVFFLLCLQYLPDIFIRQKRCQKWPEVTKSGQKWPEVTKSGQKWPEVVRSGQKWPEFSEGSRNPSFRLEKITGVCIKNAFIACGIVDKHGSCDVQHTFLFSSGFFYLKMVWNGHFESVDWQIVTQWSNQKEWIWLNK